ncbi:homoserine dehydrogenase [Acetivibrio mesophilus]|uniref:Homoserine dehydrogenase n=1 Tax=Acetivibrio mesophilus TaxID=2487273 RepID=A0A4V1K299_9FIRM|nr:homoserine dehydrogenase [Acetivibrio mesophilus]ODM25867.1 homoserine dehydrogenase [Clostridium sp. Bc-iso-3]RXE59549.1 homoserine dehydrogenase [Acetivibrio mesophilus]HHV30759.1 homoserine dehydrogenase [Clostridium sp.]
MEEVKISFLGFGNVGTGAYKIIRDNGKDILLSEGVGLKVAKILVRDINKKRDIELEHSILTDKFEEIANDPEISIVAEFMGGVEPAKDYIVSCLMNKKTVVTANKELIAKHGLELQTVARENGVGLYYEASVAGGVPVIKILAESLQANKIGEIMGIINGTTNYILTKMSEEGRDFSDVLSEAQKLGFAEPDPTADIEGFDAMYKICILSSMAFHKRVDVNNIYREGITKITTEDIEYGRELGFAIRLLAIAKKRNNTVEVRVHPTFIPVDHPLAAVRHSFNAVFLKGDAVGNIMLYGKGAGDLPTGSAIVSDIITAYHQRSKHRYISFYNDEGSAEKLKFNDDWESEFFVRLTVKDKPGVLAKIAGYFGKYGVSIASVIQKDRGKDAVPLIFVTHLAKELSMKKAISDIAKEEDVLMVENIIPVER